MYEKRFYRDYVKKQDLIPYTIIEDESDLQIYLKQDFSPKAREILLHYREELKGYIQKHKEFYHSLVPIQVSDHAPLIVKRMAEAASKVGVGPMAAVAGAVSEFVGKELLKVTDEIMIENGGDIFIKTLKKRRILVYAGKSVLSNRVALEISPEDTPMGICTSAGTVGHSLSFGKADAVVVLSQDTLLADAAATAIGNIVCSPSDVQKGIDFGKSITGVEGVLIIVDDTMGAWGKICLTEP
ncbi:MAG: UPF0280 family protein [Bacillota bacterium]